MQFYELNSLNMAEEIENIINTVKINDKRLIILLNELILDNKSINIVNLATLKFRDSELSEKDLLIYLNKYRASTVSITD